MRTAHNSGVLFVCLMWIMIIDSHTGYAACSANQIEKLVDKGFSKQEIKELCGKQSHDPRGTTQPDEVDEEDSDSGVSTTCRYSMGPKAGRTQYFRPGTPGLTPALVGQPCTDGMGSWGAAIPDKGK